MKEDVAKHQRRQEPPGEVPDAPVGKLEEMLVGQPKAVLVPGGQGHDEEGRHNHPSRAETP